MIRTVLFGTLLLLLAAVAPTAAAAIPAPDPCKLSQTCPIARVGTDPVYACAGLRFGTGGVATCAFPERGCVRQSWGYAYNEVCAPFDMIAAADLPVGVNDCDGGNVCVIARTAPDPCVGVGIGLQGVLGCYDAETQCARAYVGFNREDVCAPGVVIGPSPCTMLSTGCPHPILVNEPNVKCVGLAFDGNGGIACYVTSYGEACVVVDTGGSYWRECVRTD